MGAYLAERHHGPLPVASLAVAAAAVAVLLVASGRLGLRPPLGDGGNFGEIAPRYFTASALRLVALLLTAAMVGWFGFSTALGGAALAAVAGMPDPVGALVISGLVVGLASLDLRRWNRVAVVATTASLLLIVVVVAGLDDRDAPFRWVGDLDLLLVDLTAFVGYVAVFGLRASDFTAGLARLTDVVWSAGLLVGATLVGVAAGATVQVTTGRSDVIEVISHETGLAAGNILLALAVVSPSLAAVYSGSLALKAAVGLDPVVARLLIGSMGLALGVARFDRELLSWLAVLSATLGPLVVPLAVSAWRRRRRTQRRARLPRWVWAPASASGAALAVAGVDWALPFALTIAATMSATWAFTTARHDRALPR